MGGEIFHVQSVQAGVEDGGGKTPDRLPGRGPSLVRSLHGARFIAEAREVQGHDLEQGFFIIHQQDGFAGSFPKWRLYHRRMRTYTEYLTFQTKKHREFINITPQVESALRKSAIREGMMLVSAMHITAGVWVNDAEDGLLADIDEWLEKLAPFRQDYRHHRTGETNGDSHLKSLLVHHEVIIPITEGRLDFGPWQQVYYAEFDGQRKKRVVLKAMGE